MSNVPRIGRLLDMAGLLLFLAGGALYARAWLGFRTVPAYEPSAEDPAWSAVQLADGFWRIQKVGTALMLFGVCVFVLAWWAARRAATPTSSPDHQRD